MGEPPAKARMEETERAAWRAIGKLVNEDRQRQNIGPSTFARDLGIDRKTLSTLQDGGRRAYESTQRAIEKGLGWHPGAIGRVLAAQESLDLEALTVADMQSEDFPPRPTGPSLRHVSTSELLAELAYRFGRQEQELALLNSRRK